MAPPRRAAVYSAGLRVGNRRRSVRRQPEAASAAATGNRRRSVRRVSPRGNRRRSVRRVSPRGNRRRSVRRVSSAATGGGLFGASPPRQPEAVCSAVPRIRQPEAPGGNREEAVCSAQPPPRRRAAVCSAPPPTGGGRRVCSAGRRPAQPRPRRRPAVCSARVDPGGRRRSVRRTGGVDSRGGGGGLFGSPARRAAPVVWRPRDSVVRCPRDVGVWRRRGGGGRGRRGLFGSPAPAAGGFGAGAFGSPAPGGTVRRSARRR